MTRRLSLIAIALALASLTGCASSTEPRASCTIRPHYVGRLIQWSGAPGSTVIRIDSLYARKEVWADTVCG